MAKLLLNLVKPQPVEVGITGGRQKLRLRPFTIWDEYWLANFLDGEDLFGLDDNSPTRAVAAFLHQLEASSMQLVFVECGLQGKYSLCPDSQDTEEWKTASAQVCKIFSAAQIDPIVKALVILREQCLPDIHASAKENAANAIKKTLVWTAIFAFCCGSLAGHFLSKTFLP